MQTVLIANRGEIALRIVRGCRAVGVRSVAIHTDTDVDAPHVRAADDALRVDSYLDIDEVVQAALTTGADAVHPGYGFLSERAEFARAVADAGLTLVGPSADVMDRMGRKDHAREIAVAAGVPVVPSYGVDTPVDELAFPVLVKAAAGGGGKGMRVVRSAEEFQDALGAAAREAAKAFGDDTLLVEKYVESGRHVEVQIIADTHGSVRHLFERDCSTQRRHQKVLEEAPAPTITAEQRALVTSSAVALAAECGYTGAGTVEFLVDNATGEAYFLEMNTRLQVEHPVTELVVRVRDEPLDLVALQLYVAAGRELGFEQSDVTLDGHAIEARVYAEDSFGGFLPQAGTAELVRWPTHARVDAALESGQVVSTAYDPMLGKVIVHGPDRESARLGLINALDETAILGLTTNTGFLRALLASPEFTDASIDTAWLDRHTVPEPDPALARLFAAWAQGVVLDTTGPFAADGWRPGGDRAPLLVELDQVVTVTRDSRRSGAVDGVPVRELLAEEHQLVLSVDGRRHRATVNVTGRDIEVVHQGQRTVFARPDAFSDQAAGSGDGSILAPMPGTVLAVAVRAGEQVTEGQTLGSMEAMKMELALKAPFAGVVTEVGAAAGEQVALGALLFTVEPEEES